MKEVRSNCLPAFQCVHELPGSFETFAHQRGLLPHNAECVLEEGLLIFHGELPQVLSGVEWGGAG